MTDRAQAEVLGYLLVFSLVVLSVALVTLSGQAGLGELRDSQRTANVESGFSVLAHNVDEISQGGVPSRATELELSGERLALGPPATIRVNASDSSGELFDHSRSFRPIVFRAPDGAELVYASGAVILRGKGGGTTMVREPRMVLSSNRTIVPIVNTSWNRRGLRARPGPVDRESRVLVRAERRSRDVIDSADGIDNVTITVTSPRASAWAAFLETQGATSCVVGSGTVSCTYAADRAAVVESRIAVSFE